MLLGLESPFDKSFPGIRSVIIAFHNDDSGTQLRLNLELFRGEIHGWAYIGSGQTQLQPLRKFRFNNHPVG